MRPLALAALVVGAAAFPALPARGHEGVKLPPFALPQGYIIAVRLVFLGEGYMGLTYTTDNRTQMEVNAQLRKEYVATVWFGTDAQKLDSMSTIVSIDHDKSEVGESYRCNGHNPSVKTDVLGPIQFNCAAARGSCRAGTRIPSSWPCPPLQAA